MEGKMGNSAALAQRWFRDVWKEGGDATVHELVPPHGIGWLEGRMVTGPHEFNEARSQLLEMFPDLNIQVEDVIEQDHKVAVRWSARATHRGQALGIAPTNRPVSFRGMTWLELDGGQIVRGWDSWNLGALIQTLTAPEGSAA
jgi:steroid delta-isomerase-like uncharacterized protein